MEVGGQVGDQRSEVQDWKGGRRRGSVVEEKERIWGGSGRKGEVERKNSFLVTINGIISLINGITQV